MGIFIRLKSSFQKIYILENCLRCFGVRTGKRRWTNPPRRMTRARLITSGRIIMILNPLRPRQPIHIPSQRMRMILSQFSVILPSRSRLPLLKFKITTPRLLQARQFLRIPPSKEFCFHRCLGASII